ncbi:MAG: LuxR C-terminal-related transcriptional regulator [Coriobacteriia bacterium]|nr:LuxR C-terminal-related transcriptional regulator [Coriobacteriia bacterium]
MPSGGNRSASIDGVRSGLISRSGTTEDKWAAACGCIGLACVFSGIWLGDTQTNAILAAPNSVLIMRGFTSAIYLGFLLLVIFFVHKRTLSLRSFFSAASAVTYGLFLLGLVPVMYYALHGVRLYGDGWSWVALFLTKFAGAPLTIGLICVFAQVNRRSALRYTALGMLGSFLIFTAVSQLIGTGDISFSVCAISALLLFVCTVALVLGLGPHSSNEEIRTTQSVIGSGVIRRPVKQMLTPGLVIILLISSVMLGFLRSGYVADSASSQEASVVVLALLFVIPALWQKVRIEHVFFAGLVLATGSILLDPYLGSLSPAVAPVMRGVGTALFEVVVWTLAVWGAHNCTESLLMASASRFIITIGHLLGSQIMLFGISSMGAVSEGENAAGAIIVFAFLLLLVLLLKNPGLRAPFTVRDASDGSLANLDAKVPAVSAKDWPSGQDSQAKAQEAQAVAQEPCPSAKADAYQGDDASGSAAPATPTASPADAPAGAPDDAPTGAPVGELCAEEPSLASEEEYEYRYWKRPCALVSSTYGLTKRESEVLELLAHGYTVASMSEALFVSPNTTKMHVRNIYTKLDVHGRQDVISMVELVRQQLAEESA